MAAGVTLELRHLEQFAAEFDAVARERLDAALLENVLWSDGELDARDFCFELAEALRYAGRWGQAFAEPAFDNVFRVESWRLVGEQHMQLRLLIEGAAEAFEAIM